MAVISGERFQVVIAGGGVAGVETALALRDIAAEQVAVTLVAPEPEFVYRPMRVFESLTERPPLRIPLAQIARDAEAKLIEDALSRLDAGAKTVHTKSGRRLSYDALVLALGAAARPSFSHALTLDDRHLKEQFDGLLADVESGRVDRLGLLAPSRMPWPLPIYELALLTARRAREMGQEIAITVITPEDAPLALFGASASEAVMRLLDEHGIACVLSAHAETLAAGEVTIHPGSRHLSFDRVLSLPELVGPHVQGISADDDHGFIPVDAHCAVVGLDGVYAVGDATSFPVKHGGIAAQQAEVAAEAVAARAGVRIEPREFRPVIHGILLGAARPLYLSAHLTGGHGSSSNADETPSRGHETKIAARYLGEYLAGEALGAYLQV